MTVIELLEKSYRLENGKLGSIPISGGRTCFFLDVEIETEKAVQFQYFGKLHWLPKSAFLLDKRNSDNNCSYFLIKSFFASQIMSKF